MIILLFLIMKLIKFIYQQCQKRHCVYNYPTTMSPKKPMEEYRDEEEEVEKTQEWGKNKNKNKKAKTKN